MIDKEKRKALAISLRHLSVGLISNDDFEESIYDSFGSLPEQYYSKDNKSEDSVIVPMLELGWGTYSDLKNHKLIGPHKLTDEGLKIIARSILFLHSDQEYQWPDFNANNPMMRYSFSELLLTLLTFGQYYKNKKKIQTDEFNKYKQLGNFEYWPFFTSDEYKKRLKHQPYLQER